MRGKAVSLPHRGIASGERGFTLIELLVGLALMGLAATLLLQGVITAGIIAKDRRTVADNLEAVIGPQRVLRSAIERLRTVTRLDAAIPIIRFRGTADMLSFVGPPLDRAAPGALQEFRLTRRASGDLVLYSASTRATLLGAGDDVTGWTPNTLLHGVRTLSIAYLGPPRPGLPRGWQDRWWDRSTPPELVRVRVRFEDGDGRVWPDLVVRPRATKYGACRLDAFTGKCGDER